MGLRLGMVAGDRTKEAAMRQPLIFIRELSPAEGDKLNRIARTARAVRPGRQRAQILLDSAAGMSAPQIAAVVRTDEDQVRRVVHEFNQQGMDSLRPSWGGRPRRIRQPTLTGSWRSPAPAPAPTVCR
jgi:Winged helix-turn helix